MLFVPALGEDRRAVAMLKNIHRTPVFNAELIKFVTDFYKHYLIFERDKAHLYDINANALSQFESRNGICEGVFAENKAIVAVDIEILSFYDIKNRTTKLIRRDGPIHGLLSGPDFSSFCIAAYKGTSILLEFILRKKNVIRLEDASGVLAGIKRFFGVVEPVNVSVLYAGSTTYISNKTSKVMVFSENKLVSREFSLPIYRVAKNRYGNIVLINVDGNTIRAFDGDGREVFSQYFPFEIKDVLDSSDNISVICKYGTIYMLDFTGNIIDLGFIGQEVIDCKMSPDGLLWCLLEDNSLMIIGQETHKESAGLGQWLHLGTSSNTPLQEALIAIEGKDMAYKTKEVELQSKTRKLNKREKDLNALEANLKKESEKVALLSSNANKHNKEADDKLSHAKTIEAEILRLENIEELSKKLKEKERVSSADEAQFLAKQNEIDKIVSNVKRVEEAKQGLITKINESKKTLSVLSKEINGLTQEDFTLSKNREDTEKRISDLKSQIKQQNTFLNNAPKELASLEGEVKTSELTIKGLNEKISSLNQKITVAQHKRNEAEANLKAKSEELDQMLLSAKIVSEKEKNIPEIYNLSQKLIELINKNKGGE